MRAIIGILIALATVVGVAYIALWWGIVEPILTVAEAIDTDNLSASLVAWEVIKFFLRGTVATLVVIFGFGIAKGLIES